MRWYTIAFSRFTNQQINALQDYTKTAPFYHHQVVIVSPGAEALYYTLDGSVPTTDSQFTVARPSISLNIETLGSTTIKVIAVRGGMVSESVGEC